MANSNPLYKGTDLDIKITLTYGSEYIANGVTFELAYFDSYNHGKIWTYEVPKEQVSYASGQWVVRFPSQKQKFVGWYNVRCIVDMDVQYPTQHLGIQQVIFKHAFKLEDPILPDDTAQEISFTGHVETTLATLTGTINVTSLVQDVQYNPETLEFTITFTTGQTYTISATTLFPFRVVSELPAQVMNNVFYYTYEGTTETWTVATLVSPPGGGTVTGAGAIEKQTFCTLTATPATGYTFVNWTSPSWEQPVTTNPYAFKPESDITVTANFSNPVYFDDNGNLMFGSTTVATFDDATGTLVINTTAFPNARFRDEDNTLVLIPAQ